MPKFKKSGITSVLDLGCGAGRHSIYLAKKGFDVVGVDSSLSALKLANKWVIAENLKNAVFTQATMTDIPFRDRQFDSVISVSVIHHALKRDIVKTMNEIHRIIKENGFFLANLASAFDPRYATGEKVETRTYRSLESYEDKRFEELHHFFTEREIHRLLSCFRRVEVVRMKDKPHYWKVTAIK